VVPGFRTVTKVRLLAGGAAALKHQVARYDVEDSLLEADPRRAPLLTRIAATAGQAEAAAISDYGYGVVTGDGIAALRAALPSGVLTVADSRFNLGGVGKVDGATPNLEELCAAVGANLTSDEAIAAASEDLRQRLQARFLLTTRGSHGATLVEAGGTVVHLPVYGPDQVADVTGAGDTVLATLTLALAAGATPLEGATLANLAGGIVVTKLGTATASRDELHRAIDLATFIHD
jgi:rfaE bifunctional protein kinase chain/domain